MHPFIRPVSQVCILSVLLAACSLSRPNFYQMTEQELARYNQSLASAEQITCVELQASPSDSRRKFCGTPEEIEAMLAPQAPGVKQRSLTPDDWRIFQSRSTNPPLVPPAQPQIQQ